MNFKERAMEEAELRAAHRISDAESKRVNSLARDLFEEGAEFGFKLALEMLRGEQAKESSTAHGGDRGLAPMFWALWLEAKRELEKE